jgi:low affinity Fe/Cu permease
MPAVTVEAPMTSTTTPTDGHQTTPPGGSRPATAHAAVREIAAEAAKVHQRAAQIRQAPEQYKPKLVLSEHVRGDSVLDRIASWVNDFCGSMWVFLCITISIVAWLFLGNVVGFDKTPWPLLLTILNLPQLSIMISLQVSANRSQAASDKRAIADHETLIALHEMGRQQIDILHRQDDALAILNKFASKDMPGRQREIQDAVNKILAVVGPATAG